MEYIAGLTHDAVLLWAHGVNKTIEQGYAPNDGLRVTRNIINSTTQGVTGNIVIDENGDRLRDFKVSNFQVFWWFKKHDIVQDMHWK